MTTLKEPKETCARKEHRCDFCFDKIEKREVYMKSVHKLDEVYSWKSHIHCHKIANILDMYNQTTSDEGLTGDRFQNMIEYEYWDLIKDNPKALFKEKLMTVLDKHDIIHNLK